MSLHKNLQRLKHIDSLIRIKATGSPKELAGKVGISRSVLFEFINEMKEEGFKIAFSKTINSYYYTEEGNLTEHFFEKSLSRIEMRAITGGESFLKYFQSPIISDCELVALWKKN